MNIKFINMKRELYATVLAIGLVAMVLAQDTTILLLDEPTTYIDMAHQLEVLKIVKQPNQERQCTVVMVLHDINHAARFSHEIIAMKIGVIVATGSSREVITSEVLKKVFNIDAQVMMDPQKQIPVCFSYDNVPGEESPPEQEYSRCDFLNTSANPE